MTDEAAETSVSARVTALLRAGAGDLPLPGKGATRERWHALTALSRDDVVVGRLLEAHVDADAVLAELGARRTGRGEWWGVWAADPPRPRLRAVARGDDWSLTGTKAWCSGAGLCTHALVTADVEGSGSQGVGSSDIALFAVDLRPRGTEVDLSTWRNPGMARSRTGTVHFDAVPAIRVGGREDYLQRAGFWHGAIGVAACWLGGAHRVADTLRHRAASGLDAHALAHLGAVDAALWGATVALDGAADEVDADPRGASARVRALRARAVVESAVAVTLDHVGRALGATPLCLDAAHAAAVADLQVYVRQSHAERDLASLGELVAEGDR